jgi:predicted  nucleic acid-binding Zn-ribbon protein
MTDHTIKQCPKCGQQLRFPDNIGGMLMACPSCGNRFRSNFKLGRGRRSDYRNVLIEIFEMPDKMVSRIGLYLGKFFRF